MIRISEEEQKRRVARAQAKVTIVEAIGVACREHDLTYIELWSVLAEINQSWAWNGLREEQKNAEDDD